MSVHKKCIPEARKNCPGTLMANMSASKISKRNAHAHVYSCYKIDDDDSIRETTDDGASSGRLRDLSSSPINFPENDEDGNDSSSTSSSLFFSRHGNVRAQRLIQSIKRVKKASGGALFWEGWMIHTTDKEPLNEKRYYWRVDASYVKTKQQQEYFVYFFVIDV
jgi:hypothetical protein